jgi:NAD(P)-dependent dehydrogenase (short-subunit alcohol dehydrogenase family)
MDLNLAGKLVVVTGATANIGRATALDFAAKGAVHGFTRVLAKEVGQHGITVNCVAPCGTLSDDPAAYSRGSRFHPDNHFYRKAFKDTSPSDMAKRRRSGVLERPFAKPEDVSAAVLFLASDRAGFVTGQIFTIDGGTLP